MVEIKGEVLSESEELKRIIKFCETIDFPTAVFNSDLKCVYSKNGLITLDSKANQYLKLDNSFANEDFTSTAFIIKDVEYCAKIIKAGRFYICGLFDSRELGKMARNTDFFERLLPNIDVIQYNLMHLWDIITKIRDIGENRIAAEMEEYVLRTNQVFQNIYEYFNMILKKPNFVRVDCNQLLERLITRCNTFLAKCGRHIDYMSDFNTCYIMADERHAVCAFINAIQNSLLYSPKSCVPMVTVQNCEINKKPYVVIRIVNENSYYTERHKELYENDFSKHKIGCGKPIMMRLMEESGGELTYDETDGKVTVVMKMPELKAYENEAIFLECDQYTYYETGIPDYIEYKMREVVDLFMED